MKISQISLKFRHSISLLLLMGEEGIVREHLKESEASLKGGACGVLAGHSIEQRGYCPLP